MTDQTDLQNLTLLGQGSTQPQRKLETFPNRHPNRTYTVRLETDEFTCLCPMTGQPDFAHLLIEYVPDQKIVESKSVKLYLWSFRNEGHFHEHITNMILDDFVAALEPTTCRVLGTFKTRGGIKIQVEATYNQTN